MSPALLWLVGGLVMMVAEVLLPGVFLMWLGIAALATGGVVLLLGEPGLGIQVVAFAVFTALAVAAGLRLRGPRRAAVLNTAQSGLIGRSARVLAAGPDLRVRIGDSDWTARLAGGTPAPAEGAVLRVVAVAGTTVILGDPSAG